MWYHKLCSDHSTNSYNMQSTSKSSMIHRAILAAWFYIIIWMSFTCAYIRILPRNAYSPTIRWQFSQKSALPKGPNRPTTNLLQTRMGNALMDQESAIISLFESSKVGVAFISTLTQTFNPLAMNIMEVPQQAGSGIMWEGNNVVTNYHVVQQQKDLLVTFITANNSRASYRATLRGFDQDKDIAVLQLSPSADLSSIPSPMKLGSSNGLRSGQFVLAIGNPFGLDQTVTSGIVSGLGRQVRSPTGNMLFDLVQIDAAINPGNSGGPLLNSNGEVIGMNTALYSPNGAFAGVGFAIPVDTLKVVVDYIIKEGAFKLPYCGIEFLGVQQSRLFGHNRGLLILHTVAGSPAEKAGLRPASRKGTFPSIETISSSDVVIAVDGLTVNSESDFLRAIYTKHAGDTITITVLRKLVPSEGNKAAGTVREVNVLLKLS